LRNSEILEGARAVNPTVVDLGERTTGKGTPPSTPSHLDRDQKQGLSTKTEEGRKAIIFAKQKKKGGGGKKRKEGEKREVCQNSRHGDNPGGKRGREDNVLMVGGSGTKARKAGGERKGEGGKSCL